jgi:hypothetical protein
MFEPEDQDNQEKYRNYRIDETANQKEEYVCDLRLNS